MAIWDFRPKGGDIWTGVAVGAGLLAAPVVMPLAWSTVRPLLKAILKSGFLLYETGRQTCAELAESRREGRTAAVSDEKRPSARRVSAVKKKESEPTEKTRPTKVAGIGAHVKPRPVEHKDSNKTGEKKKIEASEHS
ncbi:MAG: hypothetical protein WBG50_13495 [Desulfomonilaceae bacterium]